MSPTPTGSFNRIPKVVEALATTISAINRAAAFNVQQRIVTSFGGPKSGRIYPVPAGVGGARHQASAPGQPPAVLFGTFSNSIDTDVTDPFEVFVYSNDEKGPYLEFGTTKMAARPSFAPAAEEEGPDYIRAMTTAMGRVR